MTCGGYNLLHWAHPSGGLAVRKLEDGVPEFWADSDGAFVGGDDPNFCLSLHGGDTWLFQAGDPANPCTISNVPEAPETDVSTTVRIVPAGDRPPRFKPPTPAPASGAFTCYCVGIRCQRLMLVQNAVATSDGKCDFSDASVRWLAPRGEDVPPDDANTRPISYPDGKPDRYVAASFPSELAAVDRRWECASNADGIGEGEQTGMFAMHFWKWKGLGQNAVSKKYLFWSPSSGAAENVLRQLETQSGLVERIFGPSGAIPAGTAFDMILLCKTFYWGEKKNISVALKKRNGNPIVDKNGNPVYWTKWKPTKNRGYFNTKVSGYLVQIVPVPPTGRSVT